MIYPVSITGIHLQAETRVLLFTVSFKTTQ